MIFQQKRTVRLSETDATGIIYFTNLFKFASETFEALLETKLESLNEEVCPIVHATANFAVPLRAFDQITITIHKMTYGKASFTVHSTITKEEKVVSEVVIKHVLVSKATGKKIRVEKYADLFRLESCTEEETSRA